MDHNFYILSLGPYISTSITKGIETKYINHGDKSSNSEYYLPCIIIYQVPQHKSLNLMDKPYVYSRSKLNDISQNNNNNNLKYTKPYEKNIIPNKIFIRIINVCTIRLHHETKSHLYYMILKILRWHAFS